MVRFGDFILSIFEHFYSIFRKQNMQVLNWDSVDMSDDSDVANGETVWCAQVSLSVLKTPQPQYPRLGGWKAHA